MKEKKLEYLNYLIYFMTGVIKDQYIKNKGFIKISESIDIKKQLEKIENNIIFSEKKTIPYFTNRKINKISKQINLMYR